MTIRSISVRRKRKGVINVPRHIGGEAKPGTNIISIEYFNSDRPKFDEGVNVFAIEGFDSGVEAGGQALVDWIQACNGENIVVHCEMGIKRSKSMAQWIAHNFGYSYIDSYSMFSNASIEDRFQPCAWKFHD